MRKISLDLYESPIPLENINNLWVDMDESNKDIKAIHRYNTGKGEWEPYMVSVDYIKDGGNDENAFPIPKNAVYFTPKRGAYVYTRYTQQLGYDIYLMEFHLNDEYNGKCFTRPGVRFFYRDRSSKVQSVEYFNINFVSSSEEIPEEAELVSEMGSGCVLVLSL